MPDALRRVVQAYEAGQPVVEVAVGAWAELGEAAGAIRREVFIEEQRIPAELEWDEADAHCLHAVARNGWHAAGHRPAAGACARRGQGGPHTCCAPCAATAWAPWCWRR